MTAKDDPLAIGRADRLAINPVGGDGDGRATVGRSAKNSLALSALLAVHEGPRISARRGVGTDALARRQIARRSAGGITNCQSNFSTRVIRLHDAPIRKPGDAKIAIGAA